MPQDPFASIATPVSKDDPFASIATDAPPLATKTSGELKQSLSEKLTQGYDPGAAEFDEKHPIIGKGVRALSSIGGTVLGTPGGIYHSFADQATPEEKAAYLKKSPEDKDFKGLTRFDLGVDRMIVNPIKTAAEFYAPAFGVGTEEDKNKLNQANIKGVLPEALGVGAGSYIVGKGQEEALSKVGQLRKSTAESQPGAVQRFARKVTQVEPAVREAVTKAAEKHGEAVAENKTQRIATAKDNLQTQREARTAIDRTKMAVGEKNKGIEAENASQAEKVAQRGTLAKAVDEQSDQLHGQLKKVEASVGKEANRKFEAVRAKIGKDVEAPSDSLIATVKNAETQTLQGIPENIKEFRSILKLSGESEDFAALRRDIMSGQGMSGIYDDLSLERKAVVDDIMKRMGGELEENKPVTWDKLQSLKSRLDARLRIRGINGDLKRALIETRDSVVNEMGKMADANGASGEWAEARDFWKNYKQDFHESTGPSGSGSPVAQSLNAADPKNMRQPFIRIQATTRNRGIDILRKYPQHGGTEAATAAEKLVKQHQEMLGLPEKVSPKDLKPVPEAFQLPENKPLPKTPEAPVVDVNKVAREALAQRAKNWGSFNARDIGILTASGIGGVLEFMFSGRGYELPIAAVTYEGGKFAASRIINKPGVIEWLSKTPQTEIDVLNKISGADKVRIMDGLTQIAIDQAKSGKPVTLSPQAKAFLGPKNVARVLAVSVASQPKTAGEARDRIRPYAPTTE